MNRPRTARSRRSAPAEVAADDLIDALRETFITLRRRQVVFLRERRLSFSEWSALQLCARGPVRGCDLAEATGLTSAGVTDVLDRLETRRLVRRASDPGDRRAVRAIVTSTGRRLHAETRGVLLEMVRTMAGQMTVEERRALAVGLGALQRAGGRPAA